MKKPARDRIPTNDGRPSCSRRPPHACTKPGRTQVRHPPTGTGGNSPSSDHRRGRGRRRPDWRRLAAVPVSMNDVTCSTFSPVRANVLSPVDPQVLTLLSQMTVTQKLNMLNGGAICPKLRLRLRGDRPSRG